MSGLAKAEIGRAMYTALLWNEHNYSQDTQIVLSHRYVTVDELKKKK